MNHSNDLNEIAAALVAVQAEVPAIPKGDVNPFFKSTYAGLPAVIEAASPIVTKHGLSVCQTMGYAENTGHDTLTTMLLHRSGQWIADTMRLHLTKDDSQGHGSATTYARRYAYMAILGLVADNDDDGNAASRSTAPPRAASKPCQAPPAPAKAPSVGAGGTTDRPSPLAAGGALSAERIVEMRAAAMAKLDGMAADEEPN